ncbi:hypothetical protein D9M68_733440 [compost metagenome]
MGHAAALLVGVANRVARGLRRDHDDVDVFTRHDLAVVHVEAVGERQRGARLDVGVHFLVVDGSDVFVGQQHHDDVGRLDGVGDFLDFQAGVGGLVPRGAALAQADHDLHAGFMQVLRVRVALRTVADDGNSLALDEGEIAVFVVENFHGCAPDSSILDICLIQM